MTPPMVPDSAAPVAVRIMSDPAHIAEVRRAVETLCAAAGFGDCGVAEVGLSVNEALANVIRHAYHNHKDRPIDIRAEMKGNQVVIELRDWGSGVVPDLNRPKPAPDTPGGLGLFCLRSMMDRVEYFKQPDGMLLRLTKTRA